MRFLLFCLGLLHIFVPVLGCFLDGLNSTFTIRENTPNDTLVLNVSKTDNITLVLYTSTGSFPPPFIEAREGSLYTNATVDLDRNPVWCARINAILVLYVRCMSAPNTEKTIFLTIELTDDFPLSFTKNFSTTIPELTAVNTTIFTTYASGNLLNTIKDEDCGTDFHKIFPVFDLENGGTSFRLQNYLSGFILVSRLLDFENGDQYFKLNISVRAKPEEDSDRNFAILEVFIHDIDDNDPAFNTSVYKLHVQEHDNASAGVWQETVPPVGAYDQDVQISDPLKYSAFRASHNITFQINETTGQVKIQDIFDREHYQSPVTVVLKVEQISNERRSATATLSIIVDDINDNRPLFSPDIYNVTIAEHSARGSTVALVTATDADEGDNKKFNYTLLSGDDRFDIRTDVIGQQVFGVVTVKNSTKLDREHTSHLQFTITTKELITPVGDACTSYCNATINISLDDINDNSPIFGNSSYDFIVRVNVVGAVIGSVTADDADEGSNALLSYRLGPYSSSSCDFMEITNTTGDIKLTRTMGHTDDCRALVTACDNPTDPSQRRCTSVPMSARLPSDVIVNVTSYSVSVAENLLAGTIVLRLQPFENTFKMTDTKYFQLEKGLLLTQVPLDRETQNAHMLFIATHNMANTNITVAVTVIDVNDNAPEFHNTSDAIVTLDSSVTVGTAIAKVTASDRDDGVNKVITYSLQPSQFSEYFHIDNETGQISLQRHLDTTLDTLDLAVQAEDGGSPPLSATHLLKILTGVRLSAPAPKSVLVADQGTIQRELSNILGVTVNIDDITSSSSSNDRSSVHISAKNATSGENITRTELQRLVDNKIEDITALFERYRQDTGSVNDEKYFTAPLIALIVVAAVLLIVLIVMIFFLTRKTKNFHRQSRLLQSLTRHNTLYESADLSKVEDGAPILDGSDDDSTTVGVVNPVYESTGSSSLDVTPRLDEEVTQQKEVPSGDAEQESEERERRKAERATDADSGVPSENGDQNGAGDTDSESSDPSKSSPLMGHARSHSGGMSYLDAVLNPGLKNVDVMNANDDDMVDVTMPPTDYNLDDVPDVQENVGDQPPEEPRVDFEEQESMMVFPDNDTGEADYLGEVDEALVASDQDSQEFVDVPGLAVAGDQGANEGDEDDDEPMPMSGLARAMLAKPPTPPMVHKSREEKEEELGPLPDEPAPDYAKKVRFNFQVIEHSEDDASQGKDQHSDGEDDGAIAKDNGSGHELPGSPTEGHKPSQEIDGPPRELKEDDEPTFHFNPTEEMTAF